MIMAAAKKRRPMTRKQIALRAEIREDLRARGIIPPKKKPLNRKEFIKEAYEDYNKTLQAMDYMGDAVNWMTSGSKSGPEKVGAAKVMKIACEICRLYGEKRDAGIRKISLDEIWERVGPIVEA